MGPRLLLSMFSELRGRRHGSLKSCHAMSRLCCYCHTQCCSLVTHGPHRHSGALPFIQKPCKKMFRCMALHGMEQPTWQRILCKPPRSSYRTQLLQHPEPRPLATHTHTRTHTNGQAQTQRRGTVHAGTSSLPPDETLTLGQGRTGSCSFLSPPMPMPRH